MDDDELMVVLHRTADAVREALDDLGEVSGWGLAGTRPGQYHSDLAADPAAVDLLVGAGCGVLSEESGLHEPDRDVVVVVDPVDGSTNASRGIPWFATSLCAVDGAGGGARAALVVNQATNTRFEAVRGKGARIDGRPVSPSATAELKTAVLGLSGFPPRYLGWKQYRALGAAALDLSLVASGALDAYVDCSRSAHGPWDYLGGMLICREAGAFVVDALGRELVALEHDARRTPVAAATESLLEELLEARTSW
jgi:fructose-1,6-bisphosphatase/inositol monophosphatase family enzyme